MGKIQCAGWGKMHSKDINKSRWILFLCDYIESNIGIPSSQESPKIIILAGDNHSRRKTPDRCIYSFNCCFL